MEPFFSGHWGASRRCIGRHARRHGFGLGHGASAGGADIGWHGFRSGRKLGSEDLQLLILAMLADQPAHGYEIIKTLGERSQGFYTPSPGMVYPALTYLEEVGYAEVEAEGAKKQYRITDAGRAHLAEHRGSVDTLLAQLAWVGEKMAHVRHAFGHEQAQQDGRPDGPLFGRRRRAWMTSALYQSGLALKAALFEKRDASLAEQDRIAQILARAAEEVRGK